MTATISRCSVCQDPLPPGSLDSLCPRCLLQRAIAPTEVVEDAIGGLSPEERDFGDYELLEKVAQGGMGIVYRARQKSLDRIVAIKLLLLGPMANEDYLKRFRFEAVAAGGLRHPNIVHIHEVGLHEGQPFIVMEYVEGQTLSRVVGGRPLPARRAAQYLKTIAEAIHAAHESGILHRDLKPSNVLIDTGDQPRVTDFGLAKRLESDSELTLSGQMLGTPNYMPPEQAASRRGKVGRWSDVYGLGAIFYHLLTGRPPQAGESVAETIQQALHVEPVKPRLLNPSVPEDAQTICLKCLEKEPQKRYRTALALAEDLQRFLGGEPILARPAGPVERAWRWCRRRPELAASLVALVLALLLGVAGVGWQARKAALEAGRATREAARANDKTEEAERNLYAADMMLAQDALNRGNRGNALELLRRHDTDDGPSGMKGWEWRHLWHRLQPDPHVVLGIHTNGANIVRFLPDGRHVASVGRDGLLKVWNFETRTQVATASLGRFSYGLAVASGAPRLATGSVTGRVQIWDTDQWTPLFHFDCGEPISAVALSREAAFCAASGSEHTFVFDLATRTEIKRIKARNFPEWLTGLCFSPDGRSLAVGSNLEPVRVFDLHGDAPPRVMQSDPVSTHPRSGEVMGLAFSPDGRVLVGTFYSSERLTDHRNIKVWEVGSGRLEHILGAHRGYVGHPAFSPDGRWLVTPGNDQNLQLWRTDTWSAEFSLAGHTFQVFSADFSPDGRFVASASKDNTVRVWDVGRMERPSDEFLAAPGRHPLRISPDGRVILVGDGSGRLSVVETETLQPLPGRELTIGRTEEVAVGPGGSQIAWTDPGTQIHLQVFEPIRKSQQLDAGGKTLSRLTFSSNGKALAAALSQHSAAVWDVHSGRVLLETDWKKNRITYLTLSQNGSTLVLGDIEGVLEIWNVGRKTRTEVRTGHKDWVASAAISPDGQMVITGGFDQQIKGWSQDGRNLFEQNSGDLVGFSVVAFSPDMRRLATGSVEGSIMVWDIQGTAPRPVVRLTRDPDDVLEMAFIPGSETLVSRAPEGVRIWRAPPRVRSGP